MTPSEAITTIALQKQSNAPTTGASVIATVALTALSAFNALRFIQARREQRR